MMKKIKLIQIFVIALGSIIFTSCEKVIDIDLNSSNPVLVAQGEIVKDSTVWIRLSYTSDYFANEALQIEENAKLTLFDGTTTEVLDYKGEGLYSGHSLMGHIGNHYELTIETDDHVFRAQSSLYKESQIYDIITEESQMPGPPSDETVYSLRVKFKNVSKDVDYYMIKLYINNKLDSYFIPDEKIFSTGDTINYPFIRKKFNQNDKVIIKLFTVDKSTSIYYNQLSDVISDGNGPGGTSTPYNPHSNFGKDVMGYFAAWSYVKDSVIVQ